MTTRATKIILVLMLSVFVARPVFAAGAYLRNLVDVRGVRDELITGVGVMTGLNGTGDKGEGAQKNLLKAIRTMGLSITNDDIKSKNVAYVTLEVRVPPFARAGQKLDVIVSSFGDAKSLAGGKLEMTSLFLGKNVIAARASGIISLGGRLDTRHPTVGKILGGAILEIDRETEFIDDDGMIELLVRKWSFAVVAQAVRDINAISQSERWDLNNIAFGDGAGAIRLYVPTMFQNNPEEFLDRVLGETRVDTAVPARVVINETTGVVTVTSAVRIDPVAISINDLTVIRTQPLDDQEPALEKWNPASAGRLAIKGIDPGTGIQELVKTLNSLKLSTSDIIAVFRSIHAAGALHGELIVE